MKEAKDGIPIVIIPDTRDLSEEGFLFADNAEVIVDRNLHAKMSEVVAAARAKRGRTTIHFDVGIRDGKDGDNGQEEPDAGYFDRHTDSNYGGGFAGEAEGSSL